MLLDVLSFSFYITGQTGGRETDGKNLQQRSPTQELNWGRCHSTTRPTYHVSFLYLKSFLWSGLGYVLSDCWKFGNSTSTGFLTTKSNVSCQISTHTHTSHSEFLFPRRCCGLKCVSCQIRCTQSTGPLKITYDLSIRVRVKVNPQMALLLLSLWLLMCMRGIWRHKKTKMEEVKQAFACICLLTLGFPTTSVCCVLALRTHTHLCLLTAVRYVGAW